MTELLKTLYWTLYTPYENQEAEQELDDCHKQLIDVLGKPERKLVLRIIDGKDRLADELGLDSFIFGFKLATQLAHELEEYLHMAVQADSKEARSAGETECAFSPAQQRQPVDCQRYGCGNGGRSPGPCTAFHNAGYLHPRL